MENTNLEIDKNIVYEVDRIIQTQTYTYSHGTLSQIYS